MELKQVNYVEYQDSLSSALLTPEQVSKLYARVKGIPSDSRLYHKDQRLISAFHQIFDSSNQKVKEALDLVGDQEGEYSQLTKGFVNVDNTYQNLEHFFVGEEASDGRWRKNVQVAKRVLMEQIGTHSLTPMVLSKRCKIDAYIANGNAICGAISIGKKKHHERLIKSSALSLKKEINESENPFEVFIPAMGGHRAQLGRIVNDEGNLNSFSDITEKDRYVWVVDAATGVFEAQYSIPVTNLFRGLDFFSPGKDPRTQRRLIREARLYSNYWVGIDYSRFDQTIPSWLISMCFDIIKTLFDEKYHYEINWIAHNFIHTKVLLPGGLLMQKHRGIPSGSGFTQIIGTLANMIIGLSYVSSICEGSIEDKIKFVKNQLRCDHTNPNKLGIFAQGDDNLIFSQRPLDLNDLSQFAKKVYGVNINPEKCDHGDRMDHPVYLKREWRSFAEYQNPIYLTVNTCHPERYRDYKGYSEWHIVYGLFLTYQDSFPNTLSEEFLIKKMTEYGGIDALERIPRDALPGVLKAFSDESKKEMIRRARKLAKLVA